MLQGEWRGISEHDIPSVPATNTSDVGIPNDFILQSEGASEACQILQQYTAYIVSTTRRADGILESFRYSSNGIVSYAEKS